MTRDLHEKLGAVTPENLFARLDPPALTGKGVIAHGAAAAEFKRGSLMAKGADGKLILIGSDRGMETYSAALKKYIDRLGLRNQVLFPGHIRFSEILAYYRTADAFVCMSEHEGFCVPLIEAMYFNVPVIAYASSAIPDTLGGAGILMDTREPAAVARMMETVRTDLVLRAALIERQRARLNEVMACQSGEAFFNFLNDFIDRRNILRRGTAS